MSGSLCCMKVLKYRGQRIVSQVTHRRHLERLQSQRNSDTSATKKIIDGDFDNKPAFRSVHKAHFLTHDISDELPSAFHEVVERVQRMKERISEMWASYQLELEAHPIRTKALTSMVGLSLGDLIAQSSTGTFDPERMMRMATFGAVIHGPSGHLWYTLLDTRVMPEKSTSPEAIVAKMALDQALFAPVFTAVFYAALTAMEGRPDEIVEVVSSRLLPTVLAGYALWPLAHLVGFKFIPSEYRLLYINAVNLVWTVHLSKMASAPMLADPCTTSGAPVPGGFPAPYTSIPVSNSSASIGIMSNAATVHTI